VAEQREKALREEILLLQELWVTVSISCDPPKDCNNAKVLKRYMADALAKAHKYEAWKDERDEDLTGILEQALKE
jgi:hypothetical protein